ncbi:hydantoinase/oxoprolinase family protein [Histidinibacterium lentulum]|uniref:Hydantoinase/oxoprolinase family protein n=1 Tax=Histidinibacterium lentulum TaxID=2480588 RepID=A0A3N2QSQ3_9RHOB|nr:hydantoinase/oxoprolinase family protein [Histidinibacterium lentulum]ROT98035.1 hydantoinase/oxoprolinase family protein [Histidinibacterium lentulum]
MAAVRAGVDIGGTFTDVALETPGGLVTAKVLTDYAAPEAAVLDGLARAAEAAGLGLSDIAQVIHGTTLVTNALIERRGARTAFVTTEGFRDVIEMRSENRFEQYDLNLELPSPLVPREDRYTLPERLAPDGTVLLPLDRAEAEAVARRIIEAGYESVAVGFLHAYASDAHERLVAEVFAALAPDLPVSLSSVVSPQMRELPRFNTVCANAYVRPRVEAYLGRLAERLRAAGIIAPLVLMHSGGGLMSVETARAVPVRLLESGPAGGAVFAAGHAAAHGIARALSFDMGGTTAKICLIDEGRPKTAATFEVARSYRFKKGSGMLIQTPVVEMVEIGAGGGSLASVDAMRRIRVGPRSAGSEPGPACYGRGGTEPAVTDANLLLGRIDPAAFAGGAIPLLPERAEAALAPLAAALDLPVTHAAHGVTETVDETMANAARVHAVENGRDIEETVMIAFGGGAPLHACRLCEKLGIHAALVPPGAGVGSAIGFLRAPVSFEAARALFQRLEALDAALVNAALAELETEARTFVAEVAGGTPAEARLVAFMRYHGQGWEIPVPLPDVRLGPDDGPALRAAFETAYRGLFGRSIDGLAVEVTNWALTVATPAPPPPPVATDRTGHNEPPPAGHRPIWEAAVREMEQAAVLPRSALCPGRAIDGPAAIVEDETTTIVSAGFRAVGQPCGSLLLIRKEARP